MFNFKNFLKTIPTITALVSTAFGNDIFHSQFSKKRYFLIMFVLSPCSFVTGHPPLRELLQGIISPPSPSSQNTRFDMVSCLLLALW